MHSFKQMTHFWEHVSQYTTHTMRWRERRIPLWFAVLWWASGYGKDKRDRSIAIYTRGLRLTADRRMICVFYLKQWAVLQGQGLTWTRAMEVIVDLIKKEVICGSGLKKQPRVEYWQDWIMFYFLFFIMDFIWFSFCVYLQCLNLRSVLPSCQSEMILIF